MADCIYYTFTPDNDPTYKKTVVDRLIQIKSRDTHSTLQYSHRYGGISCSATMADGCNGVRFRMNDYTKHPLRWKKVIIPCTDEQEDLMFAEDCRQTDFYFNKVTSLEILGPPLNQEQEGRCYFGPNALKYDKIGVVICNISHRRIIKSWESRVWCTESRIMTLLKAYPDLTDKHPDEYRPDNGHELVKNYFENFGSLKGA